MNEQSGTEAAEFLELPIVDPRVAILQSPEEETRAKEDAFASIVRQHYGICLGVAYSVTKSYEDSRDLTQEAFIKALRYIGIFDSSRGSMANWLATITRNLALNWHRDRSRQPYTVPSHNDM